jgi:flagellar biosynthetic protein FliS
MNPYRAYQQQAYSAWLRIDMILALYDGVIGKLEAARAALVRKNATGAKQPLERARLMVAGLVSAVDPSRGEMAAQFLRLYEFVNHSLEVGDVPSIDAALKVLRTLREGLEEIRPEAAELERSGQIPPAGALPGVHLTV